MVVEEIGLDVEDILVSLALSIIISWIFRIIFRILAHEENQYSYVYKIFGRFLSKALKQTKARPRSLGTPFLVFYAIHDCKKLLESPILRGGYYKKIHLKFRFGSISLI